MRAPVIRVKKLPGRAWGMALVFVILLRTDADSCVEAHEREHIRDQWKGLVIVWMLRYAYYAWVKGLRGRAHPLEFTPYLIEDQCREEATRSNHR